MNKRVLIVVIIVAIAMMIGAQSAIAAKPTTPVAGIAKGQVTYIYSTADIIVTESAPAVSGPWNVVLHAKQGKVNFNATCQTTSVGVVKLSVTGPAACIFDDVFDRWVVTAPGGLPLTFTFKCKGVQVIRTGEIYIYVSPLSMAVNFGTPGPTGVENIKGSVTLAKWVP